MKYPKLLSAIRLEHLELKNRIVMPPMATWKADDSGEVNQIHLDHYKESAGPGMIIVEAAAVSPEGRLRRGQLGIFDDRHVEGLRALAETIIAGGAVAAIQIHHAGGKATPEHAYGLTPVAPSMLHGNVAPEDIHRIQGDFVRSAMRAADAGFDIVEIHSAHGYLCSQFLSPLTNQRHDEYGGSLENRQRFLLEIIDQTQNKLSGRAMVTCRLGVVDKDPAGFAVEEGLQTAELLEKNGAPFLDISHGIGMPGPDPTAVGSFSGLMNLATETKKRVEIPVIGVGGISHPEEAERAIQEKMADLIAVGSALLTDPGWAKKAIDGRK